MTLLVPKLAVVRDQKWLDHLKTERCIITGQYGHDYESVDPAHIGTLGRGMKRSDDEVLPILHRFHAKGHNAGEISMFRENVPDDVLRDALRAYAREMYAAWAIEFASKSPHRRKWSER